MWVVNAEGIYIENRPYHSYLEDDILTAINEKYGTNFSRLTYLREPSIAIGDDCPDWNAYEKIEITVQKLAVHTNVVTNYVIGYINDNNEYVMYAFDESTFPIIANNGVVDSIGNGMSGFIDYVIKPVLQESTYAISTVITEIIPTMQVGDNIQDWNSYEKI